MPHPQWPAEFAAAGELLGRAAMFADTLNSPEWDFAVEIDELHECGLSRVDLRWLVWNGLLKHADEVAAYFSEHRVLQPTSRLAFTSRTCFVLTPAGKMAVARILGGQTSAENSTNDGASLAYKSDDGPRSHLIKPLWCPPENRLFLGNLLVKQFRRPAPHQQLILTVFQEEDWPRRIDDPLPPSQDIVPSRRLHEAIAGLNRHQSNAVMRFSSDGFGKGITWLALS